MSKMLYKKPLAEAVRFENEDIITTSGDDDNSGGHGGGFPCGGKFGGHGGGFPCGGKFGGQGGGCYGWKPGEHWF